MGIRRFVSLAAMLLLAKYLGLWIMVAWPVELVKAMGTLRPLFFIWLMVQACWLPLAVLSALLVGGRRGLVYCVLIAAAVTASDVLLSGTFEVLRWSKEDPVFVTAILLLSASAAAATYAVTMLFMRIRVARS